MLSRIEFYSVCNPPIQGHSADYPLYNAHFFRIPIARPPDTQMGTDTLPLHRHYRVLWRRE